MSGLPLFLNGVMAGLLISMITMVVAHITKRDSAAANLNNELENRYGDKR